jgi:hypothetical protein
MSFYNTKLSFVELVGLNTTQRRFQFGQEQFLRQKQIVSIEVFTANDMVTSPQNNPVMDSTLLKNSYVTFYGGDPENTTSYGEWLWRIPMVSLHRLNNATDPFTFDLFRLVPQQIIWEKSYIETEVDLTSAPMSFIFSVGYMGTGGDNI